MIGSDMVLPASLVLGDQHIAVVVLLLPRTGVWAALAVPMIAPLFAYLVLTVVGILRGHHRTVPRGGILELLLAGAGCLRDSRRSAKCVRPRLAFEGGLLRFPAR